MKKLHFSVTIMKPKETVWHAMLDDATYREWTSAFMPGSYYEGEWKEGSSMRFLAADPDGSVSGMSAEIKELRPFDFVSIRNLGEIDHGKASVWTHELTEGKEMLENYTFTETDGGTELSIDMDCPESMEEMFNGMWPKALERLKEVAERS